MNMIDASLNQTIELLKSKKISCKELTSFYLDRINKFDKKINSYITINEKALIDAEAIDQKIVKGETLGALVGLPWGIKDMICTAGLRTTAASKILENFIPPYDATVIKKLKSADAVILGKLNQDEFAMGSSNETSYFGICKNPWNTEYVPGGSSGGSAAAQALKLCSASLGTDTGGSIRLPASYCGVVGVKPTYGRISRYGVIAYASSLDQVGPITTKVEDAALALEVLCGQDKNDSTSSEQLVPKFSKNLSQNIKGKKIGLIKEYLSEKGLDSDVEKSLNTAIEGLKKEGAEIVEISIPLTEMAIPVYYLIASSECSSNLSRYDGVRYGFRSEFESLTNLSLEEFYSKSRGEAFGEEVKRRIMLGTYCLSSGYYDAYYDKACRVRRLLQNEFKEAFKKCDVIISPASSSPAFKINEKIVNPLQMYLDDIFTVSINLAGLPGMSVPYAHATSGLPIGIQIMANHFNEQEMLNVGFALEKMANLKGYIEYV